MASGGLPEHELAGFPGLRLPVPSQGLLLRRWEDGERDALRAIRDGDPATMRWTPVPQPYTSARAHATLTKWEDQWNAGTGAALAIVADPGGAIVGEINLLVRSWPDRTAELAYGVLAEARGHGVAARALLAVRDAAVDLGFRRLVLQVEPGNLASWRTATRCGFQLEGIQRSAAIDHGRPLDLAILAYVVARGSGVEQPAGR